MCDEVIFRIVTNAEMFSAYNGTGYSFINMFYIVLSEI